MHFRRLGHFLSSSRVAATSAAVAVWNANTEQKRCPKIDFAVFEQHRGVVVGYEEMWRELNILKKKDKIKKRSPKISI